MFLTLKTKKPDVPRLVDEIEQAVYTVLKPQGFRKYGRTLHRFVSGDISQVINFQSGTPRAMQGHFCVNIGIRIPECSTRTLEPCGKMKKYYHEYECTIRSRLGSVSGKRDTWYDLSKNTQRIIKSIIKETEQFVLPAFDVLHDRQSVLEHRRDFPFMDTMSSCILLEEAMIYLYLGDREKASQAFELHYQNAVDEYNDGMTNGTKHYLKKGERIVYMGQDITAEKNGFVTVYGASHGHIDCLDALREQLGI